MFFTETFYILKDVSRELLLLFVGIVTKLMIVCVCGGGGGGGDWAFLKSVICEKAENKSVTCDKGIVSGGQMKNSVICEFAK